MAGNKKRWDGVLNPGGVIGGLTCGAIVGWFAFANVDPNNIPRWAGRAPILALIGGAYVGTVAWSKCFSYFDPTAIAITAAHDQIVRCGADCPQCKLHHHEYRLIHRGKSIDEPCIVCHSCGCSSAVPEFDGMPTLKQNAA